LELDEIDQVRKATKGNFVLGGKRFQDEINIMLGRRAFSGKTGRSRAEKIQKRGLYPILKEKYDHPISSIACKNTVNIQSIFGFSMQVQYLVAG